jgi:hypothetical protein
LESHVSVIGNKVNFHEAVKYYSFACYTYQACIWTSKIMVNSFSWYFCLVFGFSKQPNFYLLLFVFWSLLPLQQSTRGAACLTRWNGRTRICLFLKYVKILSIYNYYWKKVQIVMSFFHVSVSSPFTPVPCLGLVYCSPGSSRKEYICNASNLFNL